MKDAFERRALLLHLGTILEAMNTLLAQAAGHSSSTVRELAAQHRALAKHGLLRQMPAALTATEFAQRASAAFASWPQALLEADLDRAHLARVVRDALFSANEAGWRAYVESLKAEVSWFGEGLPPMPVQPAADQTERHRKAAQSAETAQPRQAEAAEEALAGAGLYPAWPWKPQA